MNPIRLVITGGQTGADLAGWKTARKFGIPTSGYMPQGFRNLAGLWPQYAERFGAREHKEIDYPPRTLSNVLWADACLWFGDPYSSGGKLTKNLCDTYHRPFQPITGPWGCLPETHHWLLKSLEDGDTEGVLMISGNRESVDSLVEAWVSAWLSSLFREFLDIKEVSRRLPISN